MRRVPREIVEQSDENHVLIKKDMYAFDGGILSYEVDWSFDVGVVLARQLFVWDHFGILIRVLDGQANELFSPSDMQLYSNPF